MGLTCGAIYPYFAPKKGWERSAQPKFFGCVWGAPATRAPRLA
jgi:aminoglycoside N3'-acetyltransferase